MGFWDRMEKVIGQGLEASKDVLEKARDKAKEMGEKGILKFEIMQQERQAEKCFVKLGTKVYELIEEQTSVTLPDASPDVIALCKEIKGIQEKIDEKEQKLKEV